MKIPCRNRITPSQKTRKSSFEKDYKSIDGKIETLLDRIVDSESGSVMKRLEKRICDLEDKKRVIEEKIANEGSPIKPFDQMYRTVMLFLINSSKIWQLDCFEKKRAVIKLALKDRLVYDRKRGIEPQVYHYLSST